MKVIIFRVLIGLVIVGILFYVGSCAYVNFIEPIRTNAPAIDAPDSNLATYEIIIVNTGTVYLANDVKRVGSFVRLETYWELQGNKFVFQKRPLMLDENIFGIIQVNLRKK